MSVLRDSYRDDFFCGLTRWPSFTLAYFVLIQQTTKKAVEWSKKRYEG